MGNTLEPKYEKTILVVDDDPAILQFISNFLEQDYNVLTAASGQEALQVAKDCRRDLDLLLSDFEMPGMSGIQLATQLAVAAPNIKILLMSGFTGGTLVLNEGWHFMAKPFVPSQMTTLIRGLISPEIRTKF
jgi:two-component system, cell cycle sensor histidine kinase and response regulator CckA